MGDEADADWQDGLVEWGAEHAMDDVRQRYRDILNRSVRRSFFRNRKRRKPRETTAPLSEHHGEGQ